MSLWQTEGGKDPIVQLVKRYGIDVAAEKLGMKVEQVEEALVTMRYLLDFDSFALERLYIKDNIGEIKGRIIPFKLNTPQRKLLGVVERQRAARKPVRVRMLKARQWGGSTEIEALIYRDTILRPSRSSLIVAHSIESSNHLREMSELYHDRYDLAKPPIKKKTEKAWHFKHRVEGKAADSILRIDTAENLAAGHSFTAHNLHLSEIQRWPHAEDLVRGLYPTVPDSPDTMIFEEGTGSGVGDYWYESCQAAMLGVEGWEFVFVAWFERDDTVRPFESELRQAEFERTLDQDEKILLDGGVTLERLNWRRHQLGTVFKTDPDGFRQQFPANPDEAFLTSGRPVFHIPTVKKRLQEASEPKFVGNFRWTKERNVEFDEDENGYWKLWDKPRKVHNRYCIGADPVEGREIVKGLGNRGGDKAAARILDRQLRKMVGTLCARLDPDVFADELLKASTFFDCYLLPEQNAGGGGQLLVARLRDAGARLVKTPVIGKRRDEVKEEYGWETSVSSKRFMIDTLIVEIRNETYVDLDKEAWYQCTTYVRDEKGKTEAQSGKFDDLVMATAITLQADRLLPMYWEDKPEVREEIPRDMDVSKDKSPTTREEVMAKTLVEF
jgi:hypothetical protein